MPQHPCLTSCRLPADREVIEEILDVPSSPEAPPQPPIPRRPENPQGARESFFFEPGEESTTSSPQSLASSSRSACVDFDGTPTQRARLSGIRKKGMRTIFRIRDKDEFF